MVSEQPVTTRLTACSNKSRDDDPSFLAVLFIVMKVQLTVEHSSPVCRTIALRYHRCSGSQSKWFLNIFIMVRLQSTANMLAYYICEEKVLSRESKRPYRQASCVHGAPDYGYGMEGDRTKRAHDELPLRAHARRNENGTAGGGGALLLPGRRRGPANHVSAAGLLLSSR
jgi:hypothetical protein